jgi:hypothetical protein
MQSNYDPETAATVWNSPAYHTTAIKWTVAGDELVVPRGGLLEQHRVLHQRIPRGRREAVRHAEWYANAAHNELDLGGYKTAAPSNLTESPKALYWNAAATYVTGDHTIKFGTNMRWGQFIHTRNYNADLIQQYRAPAPECVGPCRTP